MNNIICIAGPTASGKTALAVDLAEVCNGEVVSCDSMQVYRRMNIGTAKPTPEEMRGIPHHMIDVAEPWEDFSVSRYCAMAAPIVEDILARGKTAIIAGGTGLYMDSLIRGGDFAPFPGSDQREALERQADEQGMESMLSRLREVDPDSAARLHPADRKRILRALEIYDATGETLTEHDRRTRMMPPRFSPVWLGLTFADRQLLYDRIDRRVESMVERGLLDEIRSLLASGIRPDCTAMQAIGYKEFVQVLAGQQPLEAAIVQVQQSSRRYAKRQLTWFRRNSRMRWLLRDGDTDDEKILVSARQLLQESDSTSMVR